MSGAVESEALRKVLKRVPQIPAKRAWDEAANPEGRRGLHLHPRGWPQPRGEPGRRFLLSWKSERFLPHPEDNLNSLRARLARKVRMQAT